MSVFPSLARWLPDDTPALDRLIVGRALIDVGLTEEPPGSNRSPTIDAYLTAAGSPLGSPWCASAVRAWLKDAGAEVPSDAAGACQTWYSYGQETGLLTPHPKPGAVVLYALDPDRPEHADHMGVIVRVDPLLLSVEGNTTYARQQGLQREGVGVEVGVVIAAHVLGYLWPRQNGVHP